AQYATILYPLKNMQAATEGKVKPDRIGARAVDDRTLELTFNYQVPYVRELLTHYTTFAVPRHVVAKFGDTWTRAENFVCNGAFRLNQWIPNDHILLAKNPRFFGAADVKLENVLFYPTQDSSAALKRFRGGEFDIVTDSVPPQHIRWLQQNLPHEIRLSPYILSQYAQFNMRRKPFDDPTAPTAPSPAITRQILSH